MLIRQFQYPADYPAVLKLWKSMEKGVRVGPSDTAAEIEKKLQRDPELFLIAESDGQIVGSVLGGFDGRRGTIYHLSVLMSHRNQNIATQLLKELEIRLQQLGCIKSYLLVNADNIHAFPFYENRGWKHTDNVIFMKEF